MHGWDNATYAIALLLSNVLALVILFFCWKSQRIGRLLFFLLFGWAGIFNWYTASNTPTDYLAYGDMALLPVYKSFIQGWFTGHIKLAVGFIAIGQLLIAMSMWMRGWIFKLGTIGGMIFLVAIIPLGVGAGFPFALIAAIAFYLLYSNRSIDYLWKSQPKSFPLRNNRMVW